MAKKSENLTSDNREVNEEQSENRDENAGKEENIAAPEHNGFTGEKDRRKSERRKQGKRLHNRRKDRNDDNSIESQLKNEISDRDDEVLKLSKEIESIKGLIQRRQADFENFKKRNLKLLEDNKKFAIRDFALDIIIINDDLLRAIDASGDIPEGESLDKAHESFVEGVSMVSKRIEDTLGKYGIVEIEALNLEFDPNFHEAVEIAAEPEVKMDTVTKVHQKGFKIDDLIVRSSKVKVSKPVCIEEEADQNRDS